MLDRLPTDVYYHMMPLSIPDWRNLVFLNRVCSQIMNEFRSLCIRNELVERIDDSDEQEETIALLDDERLKRAYSQMRFLIRYSRPCDLRVRWSVMTRNSPMTTTVMNLIIRESEEAHSGLRNSVRESEEAHSGLRGDIHNDIRNDIRENEERPHSGIAESIRLVPTATLPIRWSFICYKQTDPELRETIRDALLYGFIQHNLSWTIHNELFYMHMRRSVLHFPTVYTTMLWIRDHLADEGGRLPSYLYRLCERFRWLSPHLESVYEFARLSYIQLKDTLECIHGFIYLYDRWTSPHRSAPHDLHWTETRILLSEMLFSLILRIQNIFPSFWKEELILFYSLHNEAVKVQLARPVGHVRHSSLFQTAFRHARMILALQDSVEAQILMRD